MNAEDLIEEAELLRRPSLLLRESATGEKVIASWLAGDHREDGRIIAVSRGALSLDGAGVLVLSRSGDRIEVEEQPHRSALSEGVPLAASEAWSYPTIEGVFRFGSPHVAEWLASLGWRATNGYRSGFPDPVTVEEYESFFRTTSPLFDGRAGGVIGGWHYPWPAGDWQQFADSKLLLWTLHDSEPWYELWVHRSKLVALERTSQP